MNRFETNLRKTAALIVAMATTSLLGLIRNKLIVVLLGTSGLGLYSQIQYLVQLSHETSALGLNQGIVRAIGISEDQENKRRERAILKTAFISIFVISLLVLIGSLLFADQIAARVYADVTLGWYVRVTAFAIPLLGLSLFFYSVLIGWNKIKEHALATALSALGGLLFIVISITYLGQDGLPYFFVLWAVLQCIFFGFFFFKTQPKTLSIAALAQVRFDSQVFQELITFGVGSLLAGAFFTLANLAVRSAVIATLSLGIAGIYQGIWAISVSYTSLIKSSVGSYYPTVLARARDAADINAEANAMLQVTLLLFAPMLIILLLFSPEILRLLYSAEFSPYAYLLGFQVLGDLLRLSYFVLYMPFYVNHLRIYVGLEFGWNISFAGLALWLLPSYGLIGVIAAFAITSLVFAGLALMLGNQKLNIKIATRNLQLFASALGLLIICGVLGQQSLLIRIMLFWLILGAWWFLIITTQERANLMQLVTLSLKRK